MTDMYSCGGTSDFSAAGRVSVGGGETGCFARFHGGQAGEDVFEVVTRIDAEAVAVLDEGVEDGGFFASVFATNEEPVLGSELGGTDGVFDEVVVDLDAAVAQIGPEVGPLVEGVGDGFA